MSQTGSVVRELHYLRREPDLSARAPTWMENSRVSDPIEGGAPSMRVAVPLTPGAFLELAQTSPKALGSHLSNLSYSEGLRARAIAAAGTISDNETAIELLLPLLDDPSTLIREATIYALERHLSEPVRNRLRRVVASEAPGSLLYVAARDALDED